MEILTALAFFILGFIFGALSIVSLVLYIGKRAMSRRETAKASGEKKMSIDDRMKRVKEISTEQLDLASRADGPQKNSLDGKYKNSLISQLKALDDEKNNLLQSILEDGHDPELTTMDTNGVVTKMKLSEYMAYMGISVKPKKQESKTERLGKFTIHRGGRDDDGGGNNTTH